MCNAGLSFSAVWSSVPCEPAQYTTVIDLGTTVIINITNSAVAVKNSDAVALPAEDESWIN
jgi:hypothetical protein